MVYAYFNRFAGCVDPWDGWGNIWCLKIAPGPKHFLWLLLHNGIKMYDYLNRLNLGPQTLYRLCNLDFETIEHLFNTCPKAHALWRSVSIAISKHIHFQDGFSSGNCLCPSNSNFDKHINRLLSLPLGYSGRPDVILSFAMKLLTFSIFLSESSIMSKSILIPIPFSIEKSLYLTILLLLIALFLFVCFVGTCEAGVFGEGFYVTDINSQFICAGCCNIQAKSVIEAEALDLIVELGGIFASDLHINMIFMASAELYNAIMAGSSHHAWSLNPLTISISDFLLGLGQPSIHITPKAWLAVASSLALIGVNSNDLTLFHQGRDLPYCLMKQFVRLGVGL